MSTRACRIRGRVGAWAALAMVLLVASAGPASAATTARPILDDDSAHRGVDVQLVNDPQQDTPEETHLFPLAIHGSDKPAWAYCVELKVNVDYQDDMTEVDWDQYPDKTARFNRDRSKINWIVHHSYPALPLAQVAAQINRPQLTTAEAIGATQAAIWHYSDDTNVELADPRLTTDVAVLYGYLTDDQRNTGLDQPATTLDVISPASTTPDHNGLIGPFTVTTTATGPLTAAVDKDIALTNAEGDAIGSIQNKTQFYARFSTGSSAKQANVMLSGSGSLQAGRLFVGPTKNGQPLAQSLIVASTQNVPASTQLVVSRIVLPPVGNSSTEGQPDDGLPLLAVLGLAVLAIAAVVGIFLVVRARETDKS